MTPATRAEEKGASSQARPARRQASNAGRPPRPARSRRQYTLRRPRHRRQAEDAAAALLPEPHEVRVRHHHARQAKLHPRIEALHRRDVIRFRCCDLRIRVLLESSWSGTVSRSKSASSPRRKRSPLAPRRTTPSSCPRRAWAMASRCFRPSADATGFVLTLADGMSGKLSIDREACAVDEFLRRGRGVAAGQHREQPLATSDWGIVGLDDSRRRRLLLPVRGAERRRGTAEPAGSIASSARRWRSPRWSTSRSWPSAGSSAGRPTTRSTSIRRRRRRSPRSCSSRPRSPSRKPKADAAQGARGRRVEAGAREGRQDRQQRRQGRRDQDPEGREGSDRQEGLERGPPRRGQGAKQSVALKTLLVGHARRDDDDGDGGPQGHRAGHRQGLGRHVDARRRAGRRRQGRRASSSASATSPSAAAATARTTTATAAARTWARR